MTKVYGKNQSKILYTNIGVGGNTQNKEKKDLRLGNVFGARNSSMSPGRTNICEKDSDYAQSRYF